MTNAMMMSRLIAVLTTGVALGASTALATPQPKAAFKDSSCATAVAESFESLTEHAAKAPFARLLSETRATSSKAQECARIVAGPIVAQTNQVAAAILRSGGDRDRTALALSAVEGYRLFVSAPPRGANDIPLEVALLDYAGFRYQAAAHASPVLWTEMSKAVEFADQQWHAVSSRIADGKLQSSFAADLAAMRSAVQTTNAKHAKRAVAVELQNVDALEQFFATHRPN